MKRFAKGSPNAHRFFHARLPAVPDDGPLYPWFAHFKDNHYFLNHQIFLVNKHEKRPPISEQPPTLKTKELIRLIIMEKNQHKTHIKISREQEKK